MNRLLEGLKIIEKYEPDFDTCAEHDIIYAGNYSPEKLTLDEKLKMEELGWFESEDSWAYFT